MSHSHTSSSALDWLEPKLARLEKHGLRRRLTSRDANQAAVISIDGRELVNFGSNDYLALAADERLALAAKQAIDSVGWGAGASPLITGRGGWHRRLEQRLAELEQTEAALVFTSGYAANVGTIAALVGSGDAVYCDAKNHASIHDGCRLSGAAVHVYRHADVGHLAELLAATSARRQLIVTDTLFSMDGDVAPLAELADLAERHAAMLMVDEAHATGVFGPRGGGLVDELGLHHRVDIRLGTLSKALGSGGGFVAGRRSLIEWLVNRARSYVYSTAPPEAASAAAVAALDVVRGEPHRRSELLQRAERLRERLRSLGYDVGQSASQIVPVVVGAPDRAMRFSAELRKRGLLAPGIRPPTVPAGESMLRISLTWSHTPEMIDRFVETLSKIG